MVTTDSQARRATRVEAVALIGAPALALLFVNASAAIPYSEHNANFQHLDPYEWAVQGALWLVIVALLATVLLRREWFAEAVFIDSWLFTLLAMLVLFDGVHFDTNYRVSQFLLYAGVASGLGAYWLRLRQQERQRGQ